MLQIITIICVTHVQKNFWIRASIKQLLTKYQIFTILPQISHFHQNRNFSRIFAFFLDQLLHPYKFYGRDMAGILFFIFASCESLKQEITHRIFMQKCKLIYCFNLVVKMLTCKYYYSALWPIKVYYGNTALGTRKVLRILTNDYSNTASTRMK